MGLLGSVASALTGGYSSSKGKSSESSKLWSDKVQKAVEDKFLEGVAGIDYGQAQDLASALASRATDYNIDVEPIVNEARRQEQMKSGQTYQSLARQAGSDANSLVAAAFNEALINQESNLASLTAELEAQNQQGQLDALATAISGTTEANDAAINLGNLLKGAQTTSTAKSSKSDWNVGFISQRNAGIG